VFVGRQYYWREGRLYGWWNQWRALTYRRVLPPHPLLANEIDF